MNKLTMITLIAALLGAMVSCTMEEAELADPNSKPAMYEPYVSHTISVSELQDSSPAGKALIDLGLPGYGYWVEPGVDHTNVDILCPSGRLMTLQQEIKELGMSSAQLEEGLFIYRPREADTEVQQKKAPVCSPGCTAIYEGAGLWHCTC